MPEGLLAESARRGVRSVEQGMALLALLAAAGGPIGLGALAARAGIAPAKAHRYLVSLIRSGMATRQAASGRYGLGPAALDIGLAAIGRLDHAGAAAEALRELGARIDETVLLAVWGNRGPTVVDVVAASGAVVVNVRVGSVLSPLRSASGRVLVAHLPEATTASAIAGDRAGGAPALDAREARSIRVEGLARVEGSQLAGVSAVAAPVFDHRGRALFAVTALGAAAGFDMRDDGAVATAVREAASSLSGRLGFRGPEVPATRSA